MANRLDYLAIVIVGLAIGFLASRFLLEALAFLLGLALVVLVLQLITFTWDRKPSSLPLWIGRAMRVVIFAAAVGIGEMLA